MSTCGETTAPEPTCLSWMKLKTLPRVIEEYQQAKAWYTRIKNNHWKIGQCLNLLELFMVQFCIIMSGFLSSEQIFPALGWILIKVRILDEFISHQLDFLEKNLKTMDTKWIYKPNGIIDRIYICMCLSTRLAFFFPRLSFRFMMAAIEVVVAESLENFELFMTIVNPPKLRRSKRLRSKGNKSPGKKRKHEEIEEQLPEYFHVHECSQESDPDFVPNSDHDTEVTSASDDSHDEDEDSGEEVEICDHDAIDREIVSEVLIANDVCNLKDKLHGENQLEAVSQPDVSAG